MSRDYYLSLGPIRAPPPPLSPPDGVVGGSEFAQTSELPTPPIYDFNSCRYLSYPNNMAKPSSNMRVSTTERDRRLTLAINYFNKHKDVPIQRIAKKYKVDHKTLSNRIQGKQQSIGLSGGQNKLLTAIEVDAVVLYIHNQAYVGFPCTWQMIEGAVTCIRVQNNLPPLSAS